MSLEVRIQSMQYDPPRPELRARWLRRALRLPPLATSDCVIKDFSLTVKKGEVVALVGATGAGKTSLLRIIAGLERGFQGSVCLDGEDIAKPNRRIYLLPQTHTLLPWLSVGRNLQFNMGEGNGTSTAHELLRTFGMLDKRDSYPHSLSGGERARVALMCAMCANPQVILLDEPFRGLDQITKEKCIDDFCQWLETTEEDETTILVSHDICDAVVLANRVIVVRRSPLSIYKEFPRAAPMGRRSTEALEREKQVLDALMEVTSRKLPNRTLVAPSARTL